MRYEYLAAAFISIQLLYVTWNGTRALDAKYRSLLLLFIENSSLLLNIYLIHVQIHQIPAKFRCSLLCFLLKELI